MKIYQDCAEKMILKMITKLANITVVIKLSMVWENSLKLLSLSNATLPKKMMVDWVKLLLFGWFALLFANIHKTMNQSCHLINLNDLGYDFIWVSSQMEYSLAKKKKIMKNIH